ncbi:hypothetical protein [Miltoncostaea marina]|uniref:hypothetical protein n=1 Tax=Miltoncostaea marina TaxID=2843215 RepID=UPI001C3C2550|nr:hypothetical protein [Miltoncostaea marina]
MSTGGGTGTRAQPFMCPYCGEEDLRPADPPATHWCPACDRRFALRFLGVGRGAE